MSKYQTPECPKSELKNITILDLFQYNNENFLIKLSRLVQLKMGFVGNQNVRILNVWIPNAQKFGFQCNLVFGHSVFKHSLQLIYFDTTVFNSVELFRVDHILIWFILFHFILRFVSPRLSWIDHLIYPFYSLQRNTLLHNQAFTKCSSGQEKGGAFDFTYSLSMSSFELRYSYYKGTTWHFVQLSHHPLTGNDLRN